MTAAMSSSTREQEIRGVRLLTRDEVAWSDAEIDYLLSLLDQEREQRQAWGDEALHRQEQVADLLEALEGMLVLACQGCADKIPTSFRDDYQEWDHQYEAGYMRCGNQAAQTAIAKAKGTMNDRSPREEP